MAGNEQLLIDVTIFDNMLMESQDDGHFVIKGVFGRVDFPTGNKRYYPKPIMQRELAKLQEKINESMAYGEAEHPVDGKTFIPRISHRITKIGLTEDGYVVGEMIVLNTDYGRIIQEMLKSGGKVGISSRGFGSLSADSSGNYRVGDNYRIVTYDIVANPSTEGAYTTSYDVKKLIESLEDFPSETKSATSNKDGTRIDDKEAPAAGFKPMKGGNPVSKEHGVKDQKESRKTEPNFSEKKIEKPLGEHKTFQDNARNVAKERLLKWLNDNKFIVDSDSTGGKNEIFKKMGAKNKLD